VGTNPSLRRNEVSDSRRRPWISSGVALRSAFWVPRRAIYATVTLITSQHELLGGAGDTGYLPRDGRQPRGERLAATLALELLGRHRSPTLVDETSDRGRADVLHGQFEVFGPKTFPRSPRQDGIVVTSCSLTSLSIAWSLRFTEPTDSQTSSMIVIFACT
jgi:hypothetical protein